MQNNDKLLDIIFTEKGESIESLKEIVNQEEVEIEDIISQQDSKLHSQK